MIDIKDKVRIRRFMHAFEHENGLFCFNLYPWRKTWKEEPFAFTSLPNTTILKRFYLSSFMHFIKKNRLENEVGTVIDRFDLIQPSDTSLEAEDYEEKYILVLYKIWVVCLILIAKREITIEPVSDEIFHQLYKKSIEELEVEYDTYQKGLSLRQTTSSIQSILSSFAWSTLDTICKWYTRINTEIRGSDIGLFFD